MSTFSDILKKYESIDTHNGTDKNTTHSYGDVYDKLFSGYRSTSSILEIGFDGGGSLLAYTDYFPNATIHGIDISDQRLEKVKLHPRIETFIGDATSEATIKHFGKSYDIIIEDASHTLEHQVQHFIDYSWFVNPKGLYIIEDVAWYNIEPLKEKTAVFAETQGFNLTLFDLRDKKGRGDDILFVFQRK